ncbi:histone-like nucleoid-structuring protein Lsr2 [Mycobacteroides salmoniphilum]|uniref:Nucleoid-associated protein Lsr2 n=1 Tax=Mycobacteroides salmoniphilum TaxID=404941 RepID=A0A4R8SZW3_9MYCO|nr:Lsr2 family protein [Mycobacteroides salmoniphilum]TEA09165.1 Nucleoid-associated protein Lsr2 [Mycobacteroides salmoniphilum]
MATNNALVDDMDGTTGPHVATVPFGIGTDRWEIDVCPDNENLMRAALQPWIERARKPARRRGRYKTKGPKTDNPVAVREWARKNGHHVSPTGRLPSSIIDAYNAEITHKQH